MHCKHGTPALALGGCLHQQTSLDGNRGRPTASLIASSCLTCLYHRGAIMPMPTICGRLSRCPLNIYPSIPFSLVTVYASAPGLSLTTVVGHIDV
eukprot:scaffold247618_cov39-Prasinocladus_malaysianus.AAC.4